MTDCKASNSFACIDVKPNRYMNSVMALRVSVKADGTLKFRARLCPNGSRQVQGVDYDESYSPTIRKEAVFLTLHVAVHRDWDILNVDIGCEYKEAIPNLSRPMFMRMARDVRDYGFS
jgi:hypothetical protein